MSRLLLKNGKIVTADGVVAGKDLVVESGKIAAISENESFDNETIDLSGKTIWPGFIDVHIHGAVGVDVNAADRDGLKKVASYLASQGTTAWLPTLVPDSDENYRRVIGEINALMETQAASGIAQAVGVHYEGVFANEKMCGALRPEFFKTFSGSEVAELPRLKKGAHFTTFAPEVEGGIELVRELVKHGWIASIGHTKASLDVLDSALEAGASHLTHFYNAMSGLHHRDVGVVGWAFSRENVTFDIIADGIHVHPEMLKFACLCKGADKVSLISDAVLPTGMGDGEFDVWGEKIAVVDGRTRNERGSIAGSVITMIDAVRRMLSLGFAEVDVAKMASSNPAKLIGLEKTHGSIEIGKRADLVVLDGEGNVSLTVIGGIIAQ